MSDDPSVSSSGSSYSKKTACPHCSQDFKTESLFNHFYVKHNDDFLTAAQTWLTDVDDPFKAVRVVWTHDDGTEAPIIYTIYGCLSTKKTFTTEERAIRHFKSKPADYEIHQKEVKILRQRFAAKVKRQSNRVDDEEWIRMKNNNDINAIRALWRLVLYHDGLIQNKLLPALLKMDPGTVSSSVWGFTKKSENMPVVDLISLYHKTKNELRDMELTKELNYMKLLLLEKRMWRILFASELINEAHLAIIHVDDQFQPSTMLPSEPF